jgi:IS1 family transposase
MRSLKVARLEVDEIWIFIGMKQKNVPAEADPRLGLGDCYTFTAIDPVTKLMPCWMLGFRTSECADQFMGDLAPRFANRIQLTTNGMAGHPAAVLKHFGKNVDYAVLNKSYSTPVPTKDANRHYSPNDVTGVSKAVVIGAPDRALVSTSLVERANMSMRIGMRRFTRLTKAFSKKIENHLHAVSFYFMVYNFVKVHCSVKTTAAIAAGVTTIQWTMEDILMMADTVTFRSSN